MTGRNREHGFTLLELLVAITLLGLLMTGLLGGLRLGVRAWETGAARLEEEARLLTVHQFLRTRIAGAVPLFTTGAAGDYRLAFAGTDDEVRFVGTLPGPFVPGLQQFTLGSREDDAGERHLTIAWQPPPTADGDPGAAPEPVGRRDLLSGIESVSLAYFGAAAGEGEATWHNEWLGDEILPTLIRLRVGLPEGDRRWFPDLITRPMIDQPPFASF